MWLEQVFWEVKNGWRSHKSREGQLMNVLDILAMQEFRFCPVNNKPSVALGLSTTTKGTDPWVSVFLTTTQLPVSGAT